MRSSFYRDAVDNRLE